MTAFRDPSSFPFVATLERAFPEILAELQRLGEHDFAPSEDSLTTIADGYDETGWTWCWLAGGGAAAANRARCPATARALDAVPGLVNSGFSRFRKGTHLYPHHGELPGVLRCHLALVVPDGDVAIRFGDELGRWQAGRCLVFDDGLEHEAWNRGDGDRVVLLITFRPLH
ncbi:MAG: aspartyl/asparaginyl beta-hydroxylase domain-containing protein [Planctomycetes bacterium]|nr:aspartyl/asparaginyl beta-hydroxylase domain-containing protein [Planctomycetota bacterium]